MAALARRRVTSTQLEAMITDNGWSRLSPRQFVIPQTAEESMTPEAWVEAVYATILRRAAILGDSWPYELKHGWRLIANRDQMHSPYNALLALTVAHGWKIPTAKSPELLFEATLARALNDHGLRTAMMGTGSGAGNFLATATGAAKLLGLRFVPSAAPIHTSAKDEGVDTISMMGWPADDRPAGQWIFVGQATLARTNEWYKKLMEPRVDHWALRFSQPLHPLRFLAVPHQASRDHLAHLVSANSGLVIDRLRITISLRGVSDDEREIIDKIVALGVSDGRAAA